MSSGLIKSTGRPVIVIRGAEYRILPRKHEQRADSAISISPHHSVSAPDGSNKRVSDNASRSKCLSLFTTAPSEGKERVHLPPNEPRIVVHRSHGMSRLNRWMLFCQIRYSV
ncbi:hypothetical protein TNCV_4023701 [Trichonephila clavipes]|nr:hypothetical protein TNCV_4023701 [Trichonephila clavipes]